MKCKWGEKVFQSPNLRKTFPSNLFWIIEQNWWWMYANIHSHQLLNIFLQGAIPFCKFGSNYHGDVNAFFWASYHVWWLKSKHHVEKFDPIHGEEYPCRKVLKNLMWTQFTVVGSDPHLEWQEGHWLLYDWSDNPSLHCQLCQPDLLIGIHWAEAPLAHSHHVSHIQRYPHS